MCETYIHTRIYIYIYREPSRSIIFRPPSNTETSSSIYRNIIFYISSSDMLSSIPLLLHSHFGVKQSIFLPREFLSSPIAASSL